MAEFSPRPLSEARVRELNYGGSPCDDVCAPWQEVDADDALEDARLARGLPSDHNYLRQ